MTEPGDDPSTPPAQPPASPQPGHDPYGWQQPWPYPYQPTPRQGVPGWGVALIAGGTGLAGLLIGAFGFFFVVGLVFSGFADEELAGEDTGNYVSDPDVTDALEQPCDDLTEAADDLALFGGAEEGRAAIRELADRHRAVGTAIDGASDAEDAALMAADWRAMGTALDTFADDLADDPAARLTIPTESDEPVSIRIYYGNEECYVPPIVEALDPDLEAESY